jgi:hypothetical protein
VEEFDETCPCSSTKELCELEFGHHGKKKKTKTIVIQGMARSGF